MPVFPTVKALRVGSAPAPWGVYSSGPGRPTAPKTPGRTSSTGCGGCVVGHIRIYGVPEQYVAPDGHTWWGTYLYANDWK